ncbi:MAG: DnaA regulatory inactivator Hda, partial [Candidatus Dadabacteria bacterium]|nr:DnaA regulatory inactivator Hda [Candidatus Dadabacteria bacterium]
EPLSDSEKITVLQQRADLRGLKLSNEVADYLVKRVNRDLSNLIDLLNKLDDASLVAKKKLTIPFIKSLIEIN